MRVFLLILVFAGLVGTVAVYGQTIQEQPGTKSDTSGLTEFHIAHVRWYETNFHNLMDSFAKKIQVTDQDMNQDVNKIETISVSIWSDSDSGGITVPAYETGKDTGIFESVIYFAEKPSIGQRINVHMGDLVTAQYIDFTIPDAEKAHVSDTLVVKGFSRENDSRVDDPDFARQELFREETIPNGFGLQIFQSIGAGLIILFIAVYAIKRKRS